MLQSIASVIQALPPEDEIPPVLAIVSPVVEKLEQALRSSSRVRTADMPLILATVCLIPCQLPEEARAVAIVQLQTLSGVAKGLTRTADSLLIIDETPAERAEAERLRRARDDYRMVKLRESLFAAARSTFELWSTDASVSDVSLMSYAVDGGRLNTVHHVGAQRVLALDYVVALRYHAVVVAGGPVTGADMYGSSKAAHGGVALAGDHAHHSTGSTYPVCEFDAEDAAECGRDDGSVECTTCCVAGIAIDARPTWSHGICERAQIEFAKRWY